MIMILFLENDILNVINDPCAILDLMMEMTLYVHIMHHEPIKRLKKLQVNKTFSKSLGNVGEPKYQT